MSQSKPKETAFRPERSAKDDDVSDVGKLPPVIRDGGLFNHVLMMLEKDRTMAAWLQSCKNGPPEFYLIAAASLSKHEKSMLADASDIVIRHDDHVANRLVSLEKENQYLRSLSLTDELTGLYNYRFFSKQLDVEMARTKRTGQSCSLMMIDLDNFKNLNDTLGHDAGNQFLIAASEAMLQRLRPTDIMCRYGGDEFAIIMPATAMFDALQIARRLLKAVEGVPSRLAKSLSASIGLAEYDPTAQEELSAFVNMADRALYRAKKRGKNRICHAGKLPKERQATAVTRDEKDALLDRGK
jgi:diguanylate cyclase (GGDEF)-like protein